MAKETGETIGEAWGNLWRNGGDMKEIAAKSGIAASYIAQFTHEWLPNMPYEQITT